MNINKYISYIIFFVNIIFPIICLPINLFVIFFTRNMQIKFLKIFLFNICYSFSIFGFLYTRTDSDVYNYFLMYEYSKIIDDWTILLTNLNYYSWVALLKLMGHFNLSFQFVNLFCIFLFYFCIFYNLLFVHSYIKDTRAFKLVLLKILFTFSIFTLAQVYRNPLSFSLVMTGIILLESKKKNIIGLLVIIIGVGFHYSTLFVILIYFLSKYIKFKKSYLVISCLLFFITNPVVLNNIAQFLGNSYFLNKIQSYTIGKWADRDYSSITSIVINIGILINLFIYLYFVISHKPIKSISKSIDGIRNFILIYIIFLIPLIAYRTILDRYSFGGGGFILSILAYIIFSDKYFFKNKFHIIILIIWISYIDPNFLKFFYQEDVYLTFGGKESIFLQIFYSPIVDLIY